MAESDTRLTILVTTYNRYPFLLRLLRYYRATGAVFPLMVLDSSSEAMPHEVEGCCQGPRVTRITYETTILPTQKLYDGVRRVRTPYVVLWDDDDLMVPRTFEVGVSLLDVRPDVRVVHGATGHFQMDVAGETRAIVGILREPQKDFPEETASARLLHYLRSWTAMFHSLHRTQDLQEIFAQCRAMGFGFIPPGDVSHRIHRSDLWVELTVACLSVIQGKVQRLPDLFMLRERHAGVDSWEESSRNCDLFDWMTSPSFHSAYETFCACLSQALARQDGLSLGEARAVVKQGFWSGLGRALTNKWSVRYGPQGDDAIARWRQAARRLPGLRTAWRQVRSCLPGHELSLEALLRPASRYHADFMPMYRAIMGEPIDGNGRHGR